MSADAILLAIAGTVIAIAWVGFVLWAENGFRRIWARGRQP